MGLDSSAFMSTALVEPGLSSRASGGQLAFLVLGLLLFLVFCALRRPPGG